MIRCNGTVFIRNGVSNSALELFTVDSNVFRYLNVELAGLFSTSTHQEQGAEVVVYGSDGTYVDFMN